MGGVCCSLHACRYGLWPDGCTVFACTIFIAEPMRADTSFMLLGTMSVVVALSATLE